MGTVFSRILSCTLAVAFVSCAGAVQAATSRLIFSYARDDMMPGSALWKQVSPTSKTPNNALLLTLVIAGLIIFTNAINLGTVSMFIVITSFAVVGIYIAFQVNGN